MKITIFDEQSSYKISKKTIQFLVKKLLEKENINTDEVILHFVNKDKIKELHLRFFSDPSETDCISLPIDSPFEKKIGHMILGEVFVCTDVAEEYAKENNVNTEEELFLYIIHGILHLIGYDDIDENDNKIMRKKELECQNYLKALLK